MRVGMMSYPMLFQRNGGLQIQVRESIAALNRLGSVEASLIDPVRSRLDACDVLHVFSAINGNHRIVETAVDLGIPVVLSPLISPTWNLRAGRRARLADRLLGSLTDWNVQTSYAQMRRALELADRVIALGDAERDAIRHGFLIASDKIDVVPNGIAPRFFGASGALFRARTALQGPFVLMVGAISPYKNQLGMAQALAGMALPLVVIGEALERDAAYLQQLRATPGTLCLGPLAHDDPMLASAYAAASVLALPSQGEVFPLAVLEAMAAGTPAVLTKASALRLASSEFALQLVDANDSDALAAAVARLIAAAPSRQEVSDLVRPFTWDSLALRLAQHYHALAGTPQRAAAGGGLCAV